MTLAIKKQFSLSELGKGWEECYVSYSPATYPDMIELSKVDADSDKATQVEFMVNFIKKHVTGGKVRIEEEDGFHNFEPEYVDELPRDVADKLFAAISGVDALDPKGAAPTETSSSTDSPE